MAPELAGSEADDSRPSAASFAYLCSLPILHGSGSCPLARTEGCFSADVIRLGFGFGFGLTLSRTARL